MRSRTLVAAVLILASASLALGQPKGVKKRRPRADEFGAVTMNARSQKNDVAPVLFNHWLHRSKYTCRLCHVDIGFAMLANETGVREEDNRRGQYCGACHNGKIAFAAQGNCDRCHSVGKAVTPQFDFSAFTAQFPKGRFGNNVDWEAAEQMGRIALVDTLPEVSVKRRPLEVPKDYSIEAKMNGLPDILFSHKKHAVWNGCELCHPDIYPVKAGSTKYSMEDVFAGKYCGVCHNTVAFPTTDCQRCHTRSVAADVATGR